MKRLLMVALHLTWIVPVVMILGFEVACRNGIMALMQIESPPHEVEFEGLHLILVAYS